MAQSPLIVEVYFDLICPWCFIGKHYLERALGRWQQRSSVRPVQVRWRSVQLLPHAPLEGWPYDEFYVARLGSPERVASRRGVVIAAAEQAGLTLDFSRIGRMPNTAMAHRLLVLASEYLSPSDHALLIERLFAAYFQRGEDIGDIRTVTAIASEFEWASAPVAAALVGSLPPVVFAAADGVPLFVVDNAIELSGAQNDQVLYNALELRALAV